MTETTKSYKRRWIMLTLFGLYNMVPPIHWLQYCIISNIIVRYYGVSTFAVELSSMVFMAAYFPLMFLAMLLIDKWGLRFAALCGSIGTALGAWIKVFSIAPDRFWIGFIGQTIVALSQLFSLSIPSLLAAVWFSSDQVSTACSIGVFWNQLGVAIGFMAPPLLVKNHANLEDIANDLAYMFYYVTALCTIIALLVIFFFQKEPPLPPSITQALKSQEKTNVAVFYKSLKTLLSNGPFVTLMIAYGINVGVLNAVSTLLNQSILIHFPNGEEDAGRMGMLMVITGMVGTVVFGIILDKTRAYKATTFCIYFLTALGMAFYTFSLESSSLPATYTAMSFFGLFLTGYMPVGFELAIELTYPEPESTSSGLLLVVTMVCGIGFTMMMSWLIQNVSLFWANMSMVLVLTVGCIMTGLTPNITKRQNANHMAVPQNETEADRKESKKL